MPSCRLLQDLSLEDSAKAIGEGPRAAAIATTWKARRRALSAAVASKELTRSAGVADKCAFSERQGLACVQAEQPLSVLGAVSESFGDRLDAYVETQRTWHSAGDRQRFRDAMHLRCVSCGIRGGCQA